MAIPFVPVDNVQEIFDAIADSVAEPVVDLTLYSTLKQLTSEELQQEVDEELSNLAFLHRYGMNTSLHSMDSR